MWVSRGRAAKATTAISAGGGLSILVMPREGGIQYAAVFRGGHGRLWLLDHPPEPVIALFAPPLLADDDVRVR